MSPGTSSPPFLFKSPTYPIQIAMQWDRTIIGTCLPAVPFYTTTSSLTITFDVVV